jgi:hypothetical protein
MSETPKDRDPSTGRVKVMLGVLAVLSGIGGIFEPGPLVYGLMLIAGGVALAFLTFRQRPHHDHRP